MSIKKGEKRIAVFLAILFVFQIFSVYADETYIISDDDCTATLVDITTTSGKLYVKYEFKNDGSKKKSFSDVFYLSVFQGGYECKEEYTDRSNRNSTTDVKDGANLIVVYVYKLRDSTSLVDITMSKYFDWSSSETVVYFNPQRRKWGTKDEVTSLTTNTPKPIIQEVTNDAWICPDCGNELTSKFCPDCGVCSPTPQPTPVLTAVPIDTSKPVVNVVRLSYTLINGSSATEGEYTGETVDGFPHGYGIFLINGILYYAGDWSCGKPVDDIIDDSLKVCGLRFDGIYRSFNPNNKETGLFRFFEDGTVVYYLNSGDTPVVNITFDKEDFKDSIGVFNIRNTNEIVVIIGGKTFSGTFDESSIYLRELLSSDKWSDEVKYYFVRSV